MSGKTSTIILKVDLQCRHCYKKIRKTLCKLQDLEGGKIQIQSVVYDEKKDSITISGPFDPKKLLKKICNCKVIKDIQIVEKKPEPKPEPTPPAPEPAAPPPVEPKPAPPAPEPTPPAAPEPPAPEPEPPMPTKPKPDPPAAPAADPVPEPEAPKKVEPEPPKPGPEAKQLNHVYSYPPPVWTPGPMAPGPVCCCKPWFEAYQGGGSKCGSCGLVYGPPTPAFYGAACYNGQPTPVVYGESYYYGGKTTPVIYGESYYGGPPAPVTYGGPFYDGPPKRVVYGGSSYFDGPNNSCQVACEEEPSCRIM